MAQTQNPSRLVQSIRSREPQTPAEIREQLNAIEQLMASLDPSTDYEAAILESVNELTRLMESEGGSPAQQELNALRRGRIDVSNLPVGARGTAPAAIDEQEEGLADFQIVGTKITAKVKASESIEPFQDVRVLGDEPNLVEGVREEQEDTSPVVVRDARSPVFSTDVNQDENIFEGALTTRRGGATLRLSIASDTQTTLTVVFLDDEGNDKTTVQLNNGGDLTANALAEFDVQVPTGERVNYRLGADATVKYAKVNEVLTG